MARKRKGQALNDCPKDLNDIPYIRWMNQQIANGRHPRGLSTPPPARTAATVRPVVAQDDDDIDDDDHDKGQSTEDEVEEPEDLGMSPSDDDDDGDDAEDDAEEETQPVAQPPKRGAARASGTDKGKGKEPRKKRSAAPVARGLWSDKESTIFAAAKWFTKEELEPLEGKQGTQYWVRLLAHIKESNPGWCRGVSALQKQWRNLILLWREYKRGDGGSGNGSVEKPPWYPYLELHNQETAAAAPHAVDGGGATNVDVPAGMEVPSSRARVHETATMQAAMDCHGDAMTCIESLVREWMAQDMRLARERMSESAPPDVHRAPPDFTPPPPRGESAPPPEAALQRDDVGDVNTVTPGAEDVEIWVRGADD
ncbi:unnamed protein product [Closterium sp. Naga37s-1]|nr:unnamed protein product [Closterium sp. Naga37s-1]